MKNKKKKRNSMGTAAITFHLDKRHSSRMKRDPGMRSVKTSSKPGKNGFHVNDGYG
jgi:hypothetical protein